PRASATRERWRRSSNDCGAGCERERPSRPARDASAHGCRRARARLHGARCRARARAATRPRGVSHAAAARVYGRPHRRAALPLAAGFLVVAGVSFNRGPDWRVLGSPADSASAAARLTVDGVGISPGDGASLAARLKRGGHVRIEGAMTLDLVAPGVAAVALA